VDEVMPVTRRACLEIIERYDRVFLELRIDEHRGATRRIRESVDDVDRALGCAVAR
jgi:uncharacterized protein YqgV (UPF0045/DUF77 family)